VCGSKFWGRVVSSLPLNLARSSIEIREAVTFLLVCVAAFKSQKVKVKG
jgi:hypothetical protein